MENVTKIAAPWSAMALAALLVLLPAEQVLAQAAQKEAVSVQQTAPTDGAASHLRVPPLTENSARLLRTPSDGVLSASDGDPRRAWRPRLSEKTTTIIVVLGVALFFLMGPGKDPM